MMGALVGGFICGALIMLIGFCVGYLSCEMKNQQVIAKNGKA
jgi:hypothetical protein